MRDGFFSNRPGLWRWGVGLICLSLFGILLLLFDHALSPDYTNIRGTIIIVALAVIGIIFIALTAGKPRRQLPPGKIGLWDNRSAFWKIGLILLIMSISNTNTIITQNAPLTMLGKYDVGYIGISLMLEGERRRLGSLSNVLKVKSSIWWLGVICVVLQVVIDIAGFTYMLNLGDNFFNLLSFNSRGIAGLIIVILCIYNSKRKTAF